MEERIYIIPVTAIRHLLLREHEDRLLELNRIAPFSASDYYREGMHLIHDEIMGIDSYVTANEFTSRYCRTSLQEWIDSL